MRHSKLLLALFALLLILGACKGESPTAPPTGGGGGGGGTPNPPPTTFDMSLTASNASPVVDSTSIITATVTQNGNPAPNGTAVEFASNGGALDGGGRSIIKTTNNGVASVTLTSTVPGAVVVQAVVANVSRNVTVTFRAATVPPVPPVTAPSIESITPAIGRPQGGELIRITGKNFKAPVRVLFDVGAALPLEGFVVSVSDTLIEVISPAINLGTGQQLAATITVITQAGTATETSIVRTGAFTYRNEQLVPVISTASPNSGPVTGGTRVTIFGEGFQAPVQVLFGTAEARVINVDFNQIIVEAPTARDTSPDGSGAVVGPVDITVRNIQSATSAVITAGFAYKAALQITAAGPGSGPFTGGTRVEIDGIGFIGPVSVVIRTAEGDVALQPINVSGTRIIAITPAVAIENCEGLDGPIIVTNIINGDQAEGPSFRFDVPQPIIIDIDPDEDGIVTEGDSIEVTVANAQSGLARFRIGNRAVFPTATSFDPATGNATYTIAVPFNLDFPTETCSIGGAEGERDVELTVDVTYENIATGCEDTATDALTIEPEDPSCQTDPFSNATVTVNPENDADCANPGGGAGTTVGESSTATITFSNTGTAPLTVSAATPTGANAGDFSVTPPQRTVAAGASQNFTVTFTPTATGARNANVSFTTNDPDNGTIVVCLQGTGNAPPPAP
ncbi:MAG TPA: IPT/TIG domain-containing protein [Thermoanaerobaculia bacterium]|jgi:hypothetical protein